MHKKVAPYPGKISVAFRKGPLGYLLQDPSKEARQIKNDLKLQDKSAPVRKDDALTVIYQRGGDASDMKEVQGEYILQFEKYKGKSFRWLLENDVGYTMYLIKDLQKQEAAGTSVEEGHGKESLHSFVQYTLSFTELKTSRVSVAAEASEDDQLVGFGSRAKSTWKEIWDGRGDGYADFIMRKSCSQGTWMHKLQQYLWKKQQSAPATTNAPTKQPLGMDEDKDLENAMLSISPVKLHIQSFAVPAAAEGSTPRGSSGANKGFHMKGFRTGVK